MMELKGNFMKRLPKNYEDIGNLRDLRNHKNQPQRTSWTDLRAIDYKIDEESSIKNLLGIQY